MVLDDFNINIVKIDVEALSHTETEHGFLDVSAELFKELATYISILSCILKVDENGRPRLWNRDEAMFGGLMVRCAKLMQGFLDNVYKHKMELALIFSRCIGETAINLKYLITFKSPELIHDYIEYSLRSEKKLLDEIDKNISERGEELPIESRMKKSILRSFEMSSINPDEVDSRKKSVWGGNIYSRFQKLGMEDVYLVLFTLLSHSTHGNWQELITSHLLYDDGYFSPDVDWDRPRPQSILGLCSIIADMSLCYVNDFVNDCEDKVKLQKMIQDLLSRVIEVDRLHENFIVKKHLT